jgi:hypothetical protein
MIQLFKLKKMETYNVPKGKLTTFIDAPRWCKVSKFLRELAFELNLEIELTSEKYFLSERVYVTAHGTKPELEKFNEIVKKAIDDWNNDKND